MSQRLFILGHMNFGSTIHGTENTGQRRDDQAVQLRLMGTDPAWRIDERTKRIGREGIARARAALAAHVESADRTNSPIQVDRAA